MVTLHPRCLEAPGPALMQAQEHQLTPIRPLAIALSVAKVEVEGLDFFPDDIWEHGGRDEKQARGLILAVPSEQVGFVIVRVRGVSVVGTSRSQFA